MHLELIGLVIPLPGHMTLFSNSVPLLNNGTDTCPQLQEVIMKATDITLGAHHPGCNLIQPVISQTPRLSRGRLFAKMANKGNSGC